MRWLRPMPDSIHPPIFAALKESCGWIDYRRHHGVRAGREARGGGPEAGRGERARGEGRESTGSRELGPRVFFVDDE